MNMNVLEPIWKMKRMVKSCKMLLMGVQGIEMYK
jgi:hypothetical protein